MIRKTTVLMILKSEDMKIRKISLSEKATRAIESGVDIESGRIVISYTSSVYAGSRRC